MKFGAKSLGGKIAKFGGKISSGVSGVSGKIEKGIRQGEKIASKAVGEVAKVADSKVVQGIQQGMGIAGRALSATGIPQAQVAGAGLLAGQQGLKRGREALKSKYVPQAQARIAGVASKASSKVMGAEGKVQKTIMGGVAKASEVIGGANTLERAKPAMSEDSGVSYV